ncbi:serine hydrolase domain-containing protein [Christiangramia sediminis]|uniref:Serine hydrolase n=1 Tax=Christiangramia sediminis TaxID=2881336 RepID=A0A9X1LG95_9FLAO|nr:serine hydrolase [Christiangramia sediminis]MCB7479835.1 serine hydrolase [Christiangramia sediminis]
MKFQGILIFFFIIPTFSVSGQNMADYTSSWEGKIENSKTFNFTVVIEGLHTENAVFKISNDKNIIHTAFNFDTDKLIKIPISEDLSFTGDLSENSKEINGFIKSGLLLYQIKLTKSKTNTFLGTWNILMVDELKSLNFYLSVENGSDNEYQAYPILADDRFTGTWCANFQKKNDSISFVDFKTGLKFKGKLFSHKIQLGIYLGNSLVMQTGLKKSQSNWKIGDFATNKINGNLQLTEMESLILKDSLPNTHSVLISKNGKIIYENYFDGYNSKIPHDMRSASKSISSAIVGIAKDKYLFNTVDQSIFEFLPKKYQINKDSLNSKIDIKSLLTMSSGLDAVDFGIKRKSVASEDNYQPTQDWIKTILDAPMINEPNKHANYGSANPYLVGVAMDSIISEPLEIFMDKNLFQKLEISNYIIQTDMTGRPYFGGGMYLTPRDMMKFGKLYLNKGKSNGKQILSEKWINDSFKNYRVLENTADENGYGYLWWHYNYELNGDSIESIEARGAGGQYIFILPKLEMVVVITSGNYRNSKTQQPEKILEKYILPYIKTE